MRVARVPAAAIRSQQLPAHPEVDDDHAAGFALDSKLLASPVKATNPVALEQGRRGRLAAHDIAPARSRPDDSSSDQVRRQAAPHALNLWKLWHPGIPAGVGSFFMTLFVNR